MHKDDSQTRIAPISNLPTLYDADDEFPDKYKLELYRLNDKIRNLEADLKDKDRRLLKALTTLDDELMFWRTGLHNKVWESMGDINRRMLRIAVTIDHIKDIQPHVSPPLEIPERWRKVEEK